MKLTSTTATLGTQLVGGQQAMAMNDDDKIKAFLDMLRDNDVSPYGTWESEVQKILYDKRFTCTYHHHHHHHHVQYYRVKMIEELYLNSINLLELKK